MLCVMTCLETVVICGHTLDILVNLMERPAITKTVITIKNHKALCLS